MTSGNPIRRLRSYGDYLCLGDAASTLGNQLIDGWRDSDIESVDDEVETDSKDRGIRVYAMLRDLLSGGKLSAYGLDDDGSYDEISRSRLSKPYFDIDITRSCFRWSPEDWAPIFVSKADLKNRLAEISKMKPRQAHTYRWQDITSAAWRLALIDPRLRDAKRLIGAVQDHFVVQYDGCPEDKELRPVVNEIIAFLGDRILSRELSSPESSSDTGHDSV